MEDRKEIILKCILACIQLNPPPRDVREVTLRPMSTTMAHSRYKNMAAYIDSQLTLIDPVCTVDLSRAPTLAKLLDGMTPENRHEEYR